MADDPPKVFQKVVTMATGQEVDVTKAIEKSVVMETPIESDLGWPADQPPSNTAKGEAGNLAPPPPIGVEATGRVAGEEEPTAPANPAAAGLPGLPPNAAHTIAIEPTTGETGLIISPPAAPPLQISGDPPQVVQLEARSSSGGTSTAALGGVPIDGTPAAPTIEKAVLENHVTIDLLAASFLLLIDERLDALRQKRDNTDEAYEAIAAYEELKERIEVFLAAKAKETSVADTTISFATGINNWWSKRHVQICDKAFDMGLFGIGVTICCLAGTGGILAGAIPGAMVGGKPVVEVIKAYAKQQGHSKPE